MRLEKLIMLDVEHPFIVKMHYVYQKNYRIYFVMDYLPGGDLFKHLNIVNRFTETQVRFLVAQIVLALGYLHKELNVIYRDLKPENILFDKDGYIKLTDFGLSKQASESNTFCGTPEYLSPEMLEGTMHDKTCDWWALGIIMYELLVGIPPFYDRNQNTMFAKIQMGEIPWPSKQEQGFSVSEDAADLIKKLLNRDRMKRLGAKNDSDDILSHRFFKGTNTQKLLAYKFKAPYKPNKD